MLYVRDEEKIRRKIVARKYKEQRDIERTSFRCGLERYYETLVKEKQNEQRGNSN
jgi:hypothetical protein